MDNSIWNEWNEVHTSVLLITSAFWAVVVGAIWYYKRGGAMQPTREHEINTIVADGVIDVLYAARLKEPGEPGYISPEEADLLAKRLGNVLTMHDLTPRGTPPLKERLKKKFVMDLPPEILVTKPVTKDAKPEKTLLGLLNGASSK